MNLYRPLEETVSKEKNTMKKYARTILFAAVLVLLFSAVTVFGADKASDKKQIKARAKTFMKAAKAYKHKKIGKNVTSDVTYKYIADPVGKAVRTMNKKHMKYTISKIKVSGTSGSAKVKIKYFDGYNAFKKAFQATVKWYAKNPKAEKAAIQKKIYQYTSSYYKKASKSKSMKSTTLTLKMKKYDNGWYISKIKGKYDAAVNGNYQKAYDAVFKKK